MDDVKSEKTFEEIIERLAALFKLKLRPGDRNYEASIDADPVADSISVTEKTRSRSTNKR